MTKDTDRKTGIGSQPAGMFAERLQRACGRRKRGRSFFASCIALLLLTAGSPDAALHAQQPTSTDAHTLAQSVDNHYNRLHSLRASFTESYAGLGITRSESGTLLLLKPGRMRWDYSSPAGKLFLIDGKNAWFYTRGAAQVQRIAAKQLDDLRSPLRFLLGHTQLEKELTGLHLEGGSSGQSVLVGQPKGQEDRVRRIALTIAPATGAILGIDIEETDGATTRFTFAGEQPNVIVPDKTFHFTPPPGVPVVDAVPPV